MTEIADLVGCYVAVWNEADAERRRDRIRALWAPDGTTTYRLLEARGHDAIEARVTGSWDKWLREGKYRFRPGGMVCHHGVVKFDWVMVSLPDGATAAGGLSFLTVGEDGRLRSDYQFNPATNEPNALVDRCAAIWNEPDADARRGRIAELWAPDGAYVAEAQMWRGHDAIEACAAASRDSFAARDLVFVPANMAQAHHDALAFAWQTRPIGGGPVASAGCDLLLLADNGQIRLGYRFDMPA